MFKVIGSSGAEQALQFAKGLAQADGARLIVVHVNEVARPGAAYPVNVDEDEVQAAIRKQVEDLKQEGLEATAPTGGRDGRRRGACDRGDRGQGRSRSDRRGNTRPRPPLRATAGQRHASSAADRALPGAGRPSEVGRCLHIVETKGVSTRIKNSRGVLLLLSLAKSVRAALLLLKADIQANGRNIR